MIVKGDMVTYENVTQSCPNWVATEQTMFVVEFDGEPDLWFSQKVIKTEAEFEACLSELHESYMADWRGTKRRIPIRAFSPGRFAVIYCGGKDEVQIPG